MSEARLRIGVVGLGIGRDHLEAYREDPRCEVVAVCDRDAEKRTQYPDIPWVADAAEFLERADIDAVSIASYDADHAAQVLLALEHDKHVFVEKPLCIHESEARAIRAALTKRPHLKLSSNLILRKSPRFVHLWERIRAGDLGSLYYLEGDYLYGRVERLVAGWRTELENYSLVLGGAIHMVDLLMWLSGEAIVEVTAMQNKIATAGSAFQHPDMTAALVHFEGGALGKVSVNGACVYPHFHAINIYGTKATFHHQRDAGMLYTSAEPDAVAERIALPYRGYRRGDLIPAFVDSILVGGEPGVTAEDVFRTMAVCFAIERSVASVRPERVEKL